jgi:NADPH-dependent F420 reductase
MMQQHVAIIGGSGQQGRGIARRWSAAGFEVRLGSRSASRGAESGLEFADERISGGDYEYALRGAGFVLLSVPYSAHAPTLLALKPMLKGRLLIDITVPLQPPKVRQVFLPPGQAAALEAQALLGEEGRVVAALHHISHTHLADLSQPILGDVLVCGAKADRQEALPLLAVLGISVLDAGPLRNAIALEAMTPVLLHLNRRYGGSASLSISGLASNSR